MVITKREHPGGAAGSLLSLAEVGARAWKARDNVLLRAWSTQQLEGAGYPKTNLGKAAAIVRGFRRDAGAYVSDPVNVEFMAGPEQTLCLDDTGVCLRGYDCDDAVITCMSALYSVGVSRVWAVAASYDPQAPDVPSHVYLGVAEGAERHRLDPTVGDAIDPVSARPALREWWHDPMSQMSDEELSGGRFVGVGAPPASAPPASDWGEVLGLAGIAPHEVYEYRRIWEPFIAGTVSALRVCADAIQSQSDQLASSNASSAQTLKLYADQARGNADFLVAEWNAYHDWQEWQVIENAPAILLFFQKTVLQAGAYAKDSGASCPGVTFPAPVPLDEQNAVILALQDAKLVAAGGLQLLGIGATGALQAVGDAVTFAKEQTNRLTGAIAMPWPWIALAAGAGAYIVWQVSLMMGAGRRTAT